MDSGKVTLSFIHTTMTFNFTDVTDIRKLQKISVKTRKAEQDVSFLWNCQLFRVFPKFIISNETNVLKKADAPGETCLLNWKSSFYI